MVLEDNAHQRAIAIGSEGVESLGSAWLMSRSFVIGAAATAIYLAIGE